MRAPLSDAVITAVSRLVDDSQADGWREPSHSDITFRIEQAGLTEADPKVQRQTVGKAKRIRAVLSWALENDPAAGEKLVGSILSAIKGFGGFRPASENYVGREAIENAIAVFRGEGFELSSDGDLRPLVLDNLSRTELTAALQAYVRRARLGVLDAALLTGTGKDLLEAVAKHIVMVKWNLDSPPTSNFPTLLGQAFTAAGLTTPADKQSFDKPAQRRFERALYELGCAVNQLRNREGTGHGRPFAPTVTDIEAVAAVQAMGLISERLLAALPQPPATS